MGHWHANCRHQPRGILASGKPGERFGYLATSSKVNQTAVAMMMFGMVNWSSTWLQPGGRLNYLEFADQVIDLIEDGLG
ncbi:hypothetical protein SAMN05446935_8464 [Burkholderia sp. YR290]|nr:hypothetical protein SAMN05446935_8464 [Burkholderia sp. YR290]